MPDIKQLISIIVPVFNESESIGLLLDEVINVMSSHKFNFELIVVIDGSKDNTHQVLTQLNQKFYSNQIMLHILAFLLIHN